MSQLFEVNQTNQGNVLALKGAWQVDRIAHLDTQIAQAVEQSNGVVSIDATRLDRIDVAGALLLNVVFKRLAKQCESLKLIGLNSSAEALYQSVNQDLTEVSDNQPHLEKQAPLEKIGRHVVSSIQTIGDFFAFLGEVFLIFLNMLWNPSRLRWRSVIAEIEVSGYRALPIIGVMAFLIGVVLTYQLGTELATYGANVYIVELTGIAVLREFSPLISSVIIAGRTATAFAALIGTMKVNEEVDALKTMGLSPIESLVLPKIFALMIGLPLLVVWGDLFGVMGAMMMSKSMLGIGYKSFIIRFQQKVALKHLMLGLIKAPVFASIIAGVGCFQGFQAAGSAQSVGMRTTKAAVQAIFLIIVADALFSIVFNWMGL